jgi:hypothetical protein
MFIGYEKPWGQQLPLYGAIACRAIIELVRTITPEQIESHGWQRSNIGPDWRQPTLLPQEEYDALIAGALALRAPPAG